jgi:hypothetical protein
LPQRPQFAAARLTSKQSPPQQVLANGGHTLPQALQFAGSLAVSVHRPPQQSVPGGQHAVPQGTVPGGHTQRPSTQLLPDGQACSQLPQCLGSVWMSVHKPAHIALLPEQMQVPFWQWAPGGQQPARVR